MVVELSGPPWVSTFTYEKLHSEANSVLSIVMNRMVGDSSGNTTCRVICQRPARSIRAASIYSLLMPVIAAEKMSVLKPISFQPVMNVIDQIAQWPSEKKRIGSARPKAVCSVRFTIPPIGLKIQFHMADTATGAIIIGTKISVRYSVRQRPPIRSVKIATTSGRIIENGSTPTV